MANFVKCPLCNRIKKVRRSKYFYCCGGRWLVNPNLVASTNAKKMFKEVKNPKTTTEAEEDEGVIEIE